MESNDVVELTASLCSYVAFTQKSLPDMLTPGMKVTFIFPPAAVGSSISGRSCDLFVSTQCWKTPHFAHALLSALLLSGSVYFWTYRAELCLSV
jgi:hypothetical protein